MCVSVPVLVHRGPPLRSVHGGPLKRLRRAPQLRGAGGGVVSQVGKLCSQAGEINRNAAEE